MSWVVGTTGDEGMIPATLRGGLATWDAAITAVLSVAVGTYGLIKQYEMQQDQLALAQAQADQAATLLNLAQSQYSNVAVPAFNRLAATYDRYVTTFAPMEPTFLQFAFNPKQYVIDYTRVTATVSPCVRSEFDKARRAIARAGGACGRQACGTALTLSMAATVTEVDAANDMYRFEEDKKRWYDEFYWKKMTAGVRFASGLEQRAISGVNAAAQGVARAMASLSTSYRIADQATARQMAVLGSMSDYWGGISQGAWKMFGSSMFDMRSANSSVPVEYGHNFASEMTAGGIWALSN